MVSIKWCLNQKQGIKLIEPNEDTAKAYIKMAEDSLKVMNNEKNKSIRWAISSCYYSMYYSFYSVLQKIGIKCEIHSCTLKLLESFFMDFYSKEDLSLIKKAFSLRISAQYYADKIIDKKDAEFIFINAIGFIAKTKEILSKINQDNISNIRKIIRNFSCN